MNKYLSLYAKFCALLIGCIIVLGFLAPCLVSSDDTFLVFLGFALVLVVPPAIGIFGWHSYPHLRQLLKDQGNEKSSTNNRRAR